MLKEINVPVTLWEEAVAIIVHLLDHLPSSVVNNLTPYDVLRGKQPFVTHMRILDCVAHVLVDSRFQRKLDSKIRRSVFTGYCEDAIAYRLFDPTTQNVNISCNV